MILEDYVYLTSEDNHRSPHGGVYFQTLDLDANLYGWSVVKLDFEQALRLCIWYFRKFQYELHQVTNRWITIHTYPDRPHRIVFLERKRHLNQD